MYHHRQLRLENVLIRTLLGSMVISLVFISLQDAAGTLEQDFNGADYLMYPYV